MTYEPTQKGNPHKLTIHQHTFPKTSISRFCDERGNVSVYKIAQRKVISLKPKDIMFCAQRTWDHKSEISHIKAIEDSFQSLVKRILSGSINKLGILDTITINEFYCLWNIRNDHKHNRIKDQSIAGENIIGLARNFSQDEMEQLEKAGIYYIRPDLTIPGRFLAGPHIALNMRSASEKMSDARWGILRAAHGEFIVPDNFNNQRIVPLSPTACLFSPLQKENTILDLKRVSKINLFANGSADLDLQGVAEINRFAIETSHEYFFARNLKKCPVVFP